MRKLFFLLFIAASFCVESYAQQTQTDKLAAANQETKTALVAKLNVAGDKADKIITIENEFHTSMAVINKLPSATTAETKEKHKREHEAHVIRRQKLMELPLTGLEMEHAIETSEAIRRKHKL